MMIRARLAGAVVIAETAEARVRFVAAAVAADGQHIPAPPAPGPRLMKLARAHPDVAEALEILGKADPAPDWVELYKVFEDLTRSG